MRYVKVSLYVLSGSLALVACGKSNRSNPNSAVAPIGLYSGQMPPSYYADAGYAQGAYAPGAFANPGFDTSATSLDSLSALDGQGSWSTLGGVRYFVPRAQLVPGETEWTPIRHGHWTTNALGRQTWVSDETFGRITDHRGVWRHHNRLGWIWRSFPDNHYEPNVVSFLETNSHYGWLPYRREYADLYRGTAQYGFDDGYGNGEGLEPGVEPAFEGNTVGLSTVPRRSFLTPNVIGHMIERRAQAPSPRTLARVRSNFTARPEPTPGLTHRTTRTTAHHHAARSPTVPPAAAAAPATAPAHHTPAAHAAKPAKAGAAAGAKAAPALTLGFDPQGFGPHALTPPAREATHWVDPPAAGATAGVPSTAGQAATPEHAARQPK